MRKMKETATQRKERLQLDKCMKPKVIQDKTKYNRKRAPSEPSSFNTTNIKGGLHNREMGFTP